MPNVTISASKQNDRLDRGATGYAASMDEYMRMNSLLDVPVASVIALTAENAVVVMRAIFRAECGYAKVSPTSLTISTASHADLAAQAYGLPQEFDD